MAMHDRSAPPVRPVLSPDERGARSDADLAAALCGNQPWARREIWDRYARRVRRYLSRALWRPSQEVDDLVQEVFLRVFTRRREIRQPEALQQFVMSVAVRVLKWNLRARWVRRNMLLSDEGELPEETGDRGSEEEARDALRRCRRILDRLAPQQQTAFTLRYMEEMTLEEVAATMEVSLSTAKRLLNRATAALARHVGADQDLRRFFLQTSEGEP